MLVEMERKTEMQRDLVNIGVLCPCTVLPLITQCRSKTDFLFDRFVVQFDNRLHAKAVAFH